VGNVIICEGTLITFGFNENENKLSRGGIISNVKIADNESPPITTDPKPL
jgi:hypothetical protein